ncbi:unnamed protein product [Didymodactylos carnosus]|uniref:IF rod domain-containing protein n=1 Tax=Didymodactylos carnosus TaxID=1234261 RepID=A0A815ZIW1_9BILA|nr:unnamed protein product [Didymodactylos carnosus]CAF4454534.1 unnamed protein product [Didymodactylos carnosus]
MHQYDRIVEDDYHNVSTSTYKSQIGPRTTNVQRPRNMAANSGVMTRIFQSYSSHGSGAGVGGFGGGLAGLAGIGGSSGIPMRPGRGGSALVGVNETRVREKRDLEQLNDKFAQYLEKVRFLEAQNRKLQLELEAIQSRAGQGSSKIKEMYEIEMNQARNLIDDTGRDRAAAEVKAQKAEQEAGRYRQRYDEVVNLRNTDRSNVDRLQQQIAENEAQINLFRRRLGDLDDEARRYKAEAQRLTSEIARLQNDIQNETFLKSTLDTEKLALEDELTMLKQMHESDLNELRSRTVVDVSLDPSHFFRNELAQAIRDIRNEYEAANDQRRSELHNRYMVSYNEIVSRYTPRQELDPIRHEHTRIQEEKLRTQLLQTKNEMGYMRAKNEDLKNRIKEIQLYIDQERDGGGRHLQKNAADIEELRRRLEQLTREYEEVTTMKTSLEKEIGTYRQLLEGNDGLRPIVDHVLEEARRMETERMSRASESSGYLGYGGGGGARGGSTTIQLTHMSTSGSGASSSYGGLGGMLSGGVRPSTNAYSTLSSGFGTGRSGEGAGATGSARSSYSTTSSVRQYSSGQGQY